MSSNKHKRMGRELRFMDTAVRYLNNEEWLYDWWLTEGVADGDAERMDDTELGEEYEDMYEDIRKLFQRLMARASAESVNEEYDLFCIDREEWMR